VAVDKWDPEPAAAAGDPAGLGWALQAEAALGAQLEARRRRRRLSARRSQRRRLCLAGKHTFHLNNERMVITEYKVFASYSGVEC